MRRPVQNSLFKIWISIVVFAIMTLTISACQQNSGCSDAPMQPLSKEERRFFSTGKLFGDLTLYKSPHEPIIPIVLWNSALQTLSCFPLECSDSRSGIMRTQWIVSENFPKNRFQIQVVIMPCVPSDYIRIEALCVSVLHQICRSGKWGLVKNTGMLAYKIKEAILLKTRSNIVQQKICPSK
jgi:hypothetical protein